MDRVFKFQAPTDRINKKIKDYIRVTYKKAVKEITDNELNYVMKKFDSKLDATINARTKWIKQLSKSYNILYEILKDYINLKINLSEKCKNHLVAALFYFINPFDIIPDLTAVIGYVDDYLVLVEFLRSLNKKDKKTISYYFSCEKDI